MYYFVKRHHRTGDGHSLLHGTELCVSHKKNYWKVKKYQVWWSVWGFLLEQRLSYGTLWSSVWCLGQCVCTLQVSSHLFYFIGILPEWKGGQGVTPLRCARTPCSCHHTLVPVCHPLSSSLRNSEKSGCPHWTAGPRHSLPGTGGCYTTLLYFRTTL